MSGLCLLTADFIFVTLRSSVIAFPPRQANPTRPPMLSPPLKSHHPGSETIYALEGETEKTSVGNLGGEADSVEASIISPVFPCLHPSLPI